MNTNRHTSGRSSREAFTLVELLVVISIIALLVAITLPSLGRARQLAFRSGCANNLREISRAALAYANEGRMNRGKPGSLPTTNVTSIGDFSTDGGNTAGLWLLVQHTFVNRKVFLCPEGELRQGQQVSTNDASDANFGESKYTSYGYISMRNATLREQTTITELGAATVIVADRNPRWTSGDALSSSVGDDVNSKNHSGEGQNMAVIGGSVNWSDKPVKDGDAIYVSGDSGASTISARATLNDNLIVP